MFLRESTAGYLSIALTILSVILISLEANSRFLDTFRSTVSTITYPILALAETPYLLSIGTTEILASRASLTKENKILKDHKKKLKKSLKIFLSIKGNLNLNWEKGLNYFLQKNKLNYFFTKSQKWIEIDDKKDISKALKLIKKYKI